MTPIRKRDYARIIFSLYVQVESESAIQFLPDFFTCLATKQRNDPRCPKDQIREALLGELLNL